MLAALTLTLLLPASPQFELPDDPGAVVLWLDSKGGQVARVRTEPWLEIRADGTLRVQEPWLDTPPRTYRIGVERVKELVAAVVGEHRFLECTRADIEEALRDRHRGDDPGLVIIDATTEVVGCRLKDRRHEVALHALRFVAAREPGIRALADLAAVHELLLREMWVAELGGATALAAVLEQVNAELRALHPAVPPLREAELANGLRHADGAVEAQFHRMASDGRTVRLVASWRKEPEAEPVIGFWFAPE